MSSLTPAGVRMCQLDGLVLVPPHNATAIASVYSCACARGFAGRELGNGSLSEFEPSNLSPCAQTLRPSLDRQLAAPCPRCDVVLRAALGDTDVVWGDVDAEETLSRQRPTGMARLRSDGAHCRAWRHRCDRLGCQAAERPRSGISQALPRSVALAHVGSLCDFWSASQAKDGGSFAASVSPRHARLGATTRSPVRTLSFP